MNTNYKILEKLQRSLMVATMVALGSLAVSCGDDEEGGDDVAPIPTITSISPTSAEPGDDVTITGTDLADAKSVTFNEVAAAAIVSNSATEIVATVPENASTGKVAVTTAGGVAISESDLTVVVVGAVTVSEVSNQSATIGGTITLIGTDMATVSSVLVGDVEASISNTTDTSVEIVIGNDTALGAQTFTVVNEGGSTTTSTETLKFYVIKLLDEKYIEKFEVTDQADETGAYVDFVGSQDPFEQTIHGKSNDATVIDGSQDLPSAIDGVFWHMEGYSSTDDAGSYIGALTLATQSSGTFADFFTDALAQDIYLNVLVNFGDLPDGYAESDTEDDFVFGLRFRFDGDDYEYRTNLKSLTDAGYEPNDDGWYDLSIPATEFTADAALGTFEFTEMLRYGIVARRNYGSGTVDPYKDNGGVFWTMSFDNLSISIGGPHSYLK